MIRYIFKRLAHGFLVILGVLTIVFLLFHAMPGKPMLGKLPQNQKKILIRELGLDQPLPIQYIRYLNDLSFLSFHQDTPTAQKKYSYLKLFSFRETAVVLKAPYLRRSFTTNRRVDELLFEGLWGSTILGISSMSFALFFGVIFGVIAAIYHQKFWDSFLVTTSVIGISAPSFVSAIFISMLFGFYLSDYTGLDIQGYIWVDNPYGGRILQLKNLILPTLALGIRPLAIITQLMRSSMLEVLSEDYIRTARAKGLKNNIVILKHALKNGISPVITAVSGWLVSVLGGAFFIEYIFKWKGIGLHTIDAVLRQDLPIVMGSAILIAAIFVLVNIAVDLVVALIDPRIRLQ